MPTATVLNQCAADTLTFFNRQVRGKGEEEREICSLLVHFAEGNHGQDGTRLKLGASFISLTWQYGGPSK